MRGGHGGAVVLVQAARAPAAAHPGGDEHAAGEQGAGRPRWQDRAKLHTWPAGMRWTRSMGVPADCVWLFEGSVSCQEDVDTIAKDFRGENANNEREKKEASERRSIAVMQADDSFALQLLQEGRHGKDDMHT